jgi:hypothetical protein
MCDPRRDAISVRSCVSQRSGVSWLVSQKDVFPTQMTFSIPCFRLNALGLNGFALLGDYYKCLRLDNKQYKWMKFKISGRRL